MLALYKVLCYNILCRELLPPSDPIHIKPKSIGVPVLFSYTKKELQQNEFILLQPVTVKWYRASVPLTRSVRGGND